MDCRNAGETLARSKYVDRGWRLQSRLWPHQERDPNLPFYLDRLRNMGDNLSWVVSLDTTGVDFGHPLTPISPPFRWDPVIINSWQLSRNRYRELTMAYQLAMSTTCRYNYVIAEEGYHNTLLTFFKTQGKTEILKRSTLSEEEIDDSITWYVEPRTAVIIRLRWCSGGMQS